MGYQIKKGFSASRFYLVLFFLLHHRRPRQFQIALEARPGVHPGIVQRPHRVARKEGPIQLNQLRVLVVEPPPLGHAVDVHPLLLFVGAQPAARHEVGLHPDVGAFFARVHGAVWDHPRRQFVGWIEHVARRGARKVPVVIPRQFRQDHLAVKRQVVRNHRRRLLVRVVKGAQRLRDGDARRVAHFPGNAVNRRHLRRNDDRGVHRNVLVVILYHRLVHGVVEQETELQDVRVSGQRGATAAVIHLGQHARSLRIKYQQICRGEQGQGHMHRHMHRRWGGSSTTQIVSRHD